jgi:hypothetical protein
MDDANTSKLVLAPVPNRRRRKVVALLTKRSTASPSSYEGSTTPPPLTGHPPALKRMATVGNIPQPGAGVDSEAFEYNLPPMFSQT